MVLNGKKDQLTKIKFFTSVTKTRFSKIDRSFGFKNLNFRQLAGIH